MFSMCSELTPRAPIPDTRIPQLMQPCKCVYNFYGLYLLGFLFQGSKNAEAEQILVPDLQSFSAVVLCTENSLK